MELDAKGQITLRFDGAANIDSRMDVDKISLSGINVGDDEITLEIEQMCNRAKDDEPGYIRLTFKFPRGIERSESCTLYVREDGSLEASKDVWRPNHDHDDQITYYEVRGMKNEKALEECVVVEDEPLSVKPKIVGY